MKTRATVALVLLLVTLTAFASLPQKKPKPFDHETFYKKNCVGCHGSKAQKNFNPNLPEGQMIDAILNGLPMPEPPDMPAFSEKGLNEEHARALIAYMKSIHE